MTVWGFDGAHGTDVRPPHVTAAKAWAKDESVPGVNDGTRLTASIVNRLVGNIRRAAELFGFTLTQTSDDDLAGIISAGIASSAQLAAAKGQPNGYAGLDSAGKVPVSALPDSLVGAMSYQGVWNASINSPTLASGVGTKGHYYRVTTAGSTTIDGNSSWNIGDFIAFNGTTWDKFDTTDAVTSVAGRTGAVTLAKADVSGLTKINVRGADLASASSVNLTNATGDYVAITGTTTITTLVLADGEERTVRFAGILTLTNGASLVLPTGANIVTAAGDTAVFRGEASSVVRCVSYQRANGQSLVASSSLQSNVTANITVGYTFTPNAIGTVSSGTMTPNPALGNYQHYTNNGAHTLAAPTSDCAIDIFVTNGASAGSITFSGFTVASGNTGDLLTTTNTQRFIVSIRRVNSVATYLIKALQ